MLKTLKHSANTATEQDIDICAIQTPCIYLNLKIGAIVFLESLRDWWPVMNKAPAFQHYPDKWITDTRRLTWFAKGIYRELLDVIWLQYQDTCSIPDDDELIAAEIGCTVDEWREARKEIQNKHRPMLQVESNRLISFGLRKEHIKQATRREQLRANGMKGGRPLKVNQEVISVKPDDNQNESLPSPSSSPVPSPAVAVDYNTDFEIVWKAYPNKRGKDKAERSYIKACKSNKVDVEMAMTGLQRYKDYVEQSRVNGFELAWQNGSTWFYNHGWADEYTIDDAGKPASKPGVFVSKIPEN